MHFLRFSFRQAFQGLWRNSVMTFAATFTMILMLILLSALVIVINGVEAGLEYVESRVEVRAELHPVSDARIAEFQARLDQANAALETAEVEKRFAQIDLNRAREHRERTVIPQFELDAAERKSQVAKDYNWLQAYSSRDTRAEKE